MRRLSCLVCALLLIGLGRADAQTAKIQADINKKLEQKRAEQKDGLEKLIAEALKNNPDIRVGESKVRDAEAELQRTRMKVLSEITVVHAEMQAAEAAVEEAARRHERAQQMFAKGVMSVEQHDEVQSTYLKAKATLAVIQAKLPYLLGKAGGSTAGLNETVQRRLLEELQMRLQRQAEVEREFQRAQVELSKQLEATQKNLSKTTSDEEFLRRATLDLLGRTPTAGEMKEFKESKAQDRREKWMEKIKKARMQQSPTSGSSLQKKAIDLGIERLELDLSGAQLEFVEPRRDSPMAAKLRKTLDTPTTLEAHNIPPREAIDLVHDRWLGGVNLIVRVKEFKNQPLDISMKEPVALGALLEYLEDELRVKFVLRDYGVVVVSAEERLPPGAVRVIDLWKRAKASDKTNPTKDKN